MTKAINLLLVSVSGYLAYATFRAERWGWCALMAVLCVVNAIALFKSRGNGA